MLCRSINSYIFYIFFLHESLIRVQIGYMMCKKQKFNIIWQQIIHKITDSNNLGLPSELICFHKTHILLFGLCFLLWTVLSNPSRPISTVFSRRCLLYRLDEFLEFRVLLETFFKFASYLDLELFVQSDRNTLPSFFWKFTKNINFKPSHHQMLWKYEVELVDARSPTVVIPFSQDTLSHPCTMLYRSCSWTPYYLLFLLRVAITTSIFDKGYPNVRPYYFQEVVYFDWMVQNRSSSEQ